MTDHQLADQIVQAAQTEVNRFLAQAGTLKGAAAVRAMLALYLSGGNQVASYLVRADGAATPQQVERALLIVGKANGLVLGSPKGE